MLQQLCAALDTPPLPTWCCNSCVPPLTHTPSPPGAAGRPPSRGRPPPLRPPQTWRAPRGLRRDRGARRGTQDTYVTRMQHLCRGTCKAHVPCRFSNLHTPCATGHGHAHRHPPAQALAAAATAAAALVAVGRDHPSTFPSQEPCAFKPTWEDHQAQAQAHKGTSTSRQANALCCTDSCADKSVAAAWPKIRSRYCAAMLLPPTRKTGVRVTHLGDRPWAAAPGGARLARGRGGGRRLGGSSRWAGNRAAVCEGP